MTVLSLENVEMAYPSEAGPAPVLRGLSLHVAAGETVALTGESGSGKSTALNLAAGLDAPDAGTVTVEGRALSSLGEAGRAALRRDRIGLIFQAFNLIPSLDVRANLTFQADLKGLSIDPRPLAGRLGLADHLTKYPEQLSGGQQQRVAIGRALLAEPALVLADEPTGNLDEATGTAVMDEMLALVRDTGAALLVVTHSDRLAAAMDRRLHLTRGRLTDLNSASEDADAA